MGARSIVTKKLPDDAERSATEPGGRSVGSGAGNKDSYLARFAELARDKPREEAVKTMVGPGDFERAGYIERGILQRFGLIEDHYVIDVGCGSGRLARYLAAYPELRYLGIDVVPDLLEWARDQCRRDDWRFEETTGFSIPEADGKADIVTFFSVFTHLLHEQTFLYLRDARRVLKPGGMVVFSFLEFSSRSQQRLFLKMVESVDRRTALSIFFDRPAIEFWAGELDFEIVDILDGHKPQVETQPGDRFLDGRTVEGPLRLGQSVCVLRKP
jgi:2-polyprenyl-3-methyl-5-hydroxy-6-metoxy-1,4-benzoquinol methylase